MACLPVLDYGTSFTRRAMSIPAVELHEPDLQHTEMIAFRNPFGAYYCKKNICEIRDDLAVKYCSLVRAQLVVAPSLAL